MAKSKRTLTAAGVTRETLEETPVRVTKFLLGLATRPSARRHMATRGYDKAEHKLGWSLIEKVAAYEIDDNVTDIEVRDAINEIDLWDEPNIRIIRAGLTRHPEIRAIVLQGIEPVAGPDAVVNVGKILERLNELEKTPEGTAALATLAARRIDATERRRVAALVAIAKKGTDGHSSDTDESDVREDGDKVFEQALLELREWYTEWAEVARVVIKRRDHLIALGLAERRSPGTAGADEDVVVDNDPFLPDPADTPVTT